MAKTTYSIKVLKAFAELYLKYGSLRAVAKKQRITYHDARDMVLAAVEKGILDRSQVSSDNQGALVKHSGRVKAMQPKVMDAPVKGGVKRYLLTCAQNNTKVHEQFWENLQALAAHYSAEIMVSRQTYIKRNYGAADKIVAIRGKGLYDTVIEWDERLEPFFSDERVQLANGLMWCGEMNIIPTASNPLSGLETYTGRKSGIFPHTKIAMHSIASGKGEGTKFNYTTGAVTQRNYIARKAGLKAEFHHTYGAALVEVDGDGDWFVRQINADSTGTIYDLDLQVKHGTVSNGHRPKAILHGDIHVIEIDKVVENTIWGTGGLMDSLKPMEQHMGDILTHRGRSHHSIKDPLEMFKYHLDGSENVRNEVDITAQFLVRSSRPWCKTVVVDSNHHHHLARWLKEQDGRKDPVNAEFWIAMSRRIYGRMRNTLKEPNYLWEAFEEVGYDLKHIKFLEQDESYVICKDASGGIECGMHGDLGPNGSRGSIKAFARMGRKANVGHSHIAGIHDGIYQAGTCSGMDLDWVRGPSAWSHSAVLTYQNGKRTILTMWKKKWKA